MTRTTAQVAPLGLRAVRGARALSKVKAGAALVLGGLTGGGAIVAFVGTEIAFEVALTMVERGLAWVIEAPAAEVGVPAVMPGRPGGAPVAEPGTGGMLGQGDPMVRDPAIAPGTGPVIVELEFAPQPEDRVSDILKTKKGSIRQAPLPSGSPSWSDLEAEDPTWAEVVANAKANKPGWKTFKKLLEQGRFNK